MWHRLQVAWIATSECFSSIWTKISLKMYWYSEHCGQWCDGIRPSRRKSHDWRNSEQKWSSAWTGRTFDVNVIDHEINSSGPSSTQTINTEEGQNQYLYEKRGATTWAMREWCALDWRFLQNRASWQLTTTITAVTSTVCSSRRRCRLMSVPWTELLDTDLHKKFAVSLWKRRT